jgi:RING finger/CHY zinc finger protein 1
LPEYGCKHYKRRCALLAPCCNEYFACRLCHDEVKDHVSMGKHAHTLDRKTVQRVKCLLCDHEQKVSNTCDKCGTTFGNYFCEICRLYDDDTSKQQFHCEGCGICRRGGRENFFHCDNCGCCFHNDLRDNHKCVERSLEQNCPVCFEFLFNSTKSVTILPCGHSIHAVCFNQMQRALVRTNFMKAQTCPVCSKSVCDRSSLWEHVDREVAATPMPEEYRDKVVPILCNDCGTQSQVAFHILAMKCTSCNSYNTRQVR